MSSSSSDSQVTPEKSELEHFLHEHPLIFFENVSEPGLCKICNQSMSDGPIYGCIKCSFYVHTLCTRLPKQLRNMLHPAHLLELSGLHSFECDACKEQDFCSRSYKCMLCDFNLHLECSLEHIFEEPQGHKEHKFKILKPTLFTCDACGVDEVEKCISCVCTTCQLQVHKKCTNSYPFNIKEQRHSHLLNLTYSFQIDPSFADKICKICFRKMNDVLFMYCCADCSYITHVKCGVSTNTLDDDHRVLEIEDKVFNLVTLESKETRKQRVEHFSHPHSLILNINGPNSVILCDGCVRPISEPFYSCDQCSFFLHQHCFELKEKIQHPLHAHELTMVSAWDKQFQNSYRFNTIWVLLECYGCGFPCNGFMYRCKECKFFLDLGCSLLPDILSHEGHKCALTLIDMYVKHNGHHTRHETECSACGLNCVNKFVCEGCKFNLDLQCASLPKMVPHECPKHDWNIHPFQLMYYSIEDGRGEFYCNVCEEERNENPNHWFYECQDCDYSAHPRCILGHDRVKYGSLHKIKDHPHCVRFLLVTNGKHTCKTCLDPCEKDMPVFTCEECDAHFHFSCASLIVAT